MFNSLLGLNDEIRIDHVWACGSPFSKNSFFREALKAILPNSQIRFDRGLDASFGAVLAVASYDEKLS